MRRESLTTLGKQFNPTVEENKKSSYQRRRNNPFWGRKDSGTQLFIDSEHELVGWWCQFIQLTSVRGTARQSPALGTRLVSIHT